MSKATEPRDPMNTFRRFAGVRDGHRYKFLEQSDGLANQAGLWTRKHAILVTTLILLMGLAGVLVSSGRAWLEPPVVQRPGLKYYPHAGVPGSCETISEGYACAERISHFWGQYSSYFSVPSHVSPEVPDGCEINFVQVLSRHGARDPTASKSAAYRETIQQIHDNVKVFKKPYGFLKKYKYKLGADQLTSFGERQMVNSAIMFYDRYEALARSTVPFVRASGSDRVVASAEKWNQGFRTAKLADDQAIHNSDAYPWVNVIIPEADSGVNNTLNHDLCTSFEQSTIGDDAKGQWATVFLPPIQRRLNADLPGANLSIEQTLHLMDLCPFHTVASPLGKTSLFCRLFSEKEWHQYNYYESLDKWYGYSHGNPLGPAQGIGFVNELLARITNTAVNDRGSVNTTLDDDERTFPLFRPLYADFSHDNDITAILAALQVYNRSGEQLPLTSVVEAEDVQGYSAAWTVPFAARVFVEKMRCTGELSELVRVVVNDRVLPLPQCDGDSIGRCKLLAFIDSLTWAMKGGNWADCFRGPDLSDDA